MYLIRNSYKSIPVKLDLDLLNTIVAMRYDLVRRTRHTAGLMNTLAFLPVPASVIEASRARRPRKNNGIHFQDGGGTEEANNAANFFGLRPGDGPLVVVERLGQLRRVAARWDPEGFFQRRVVGGFKIEER